MRRLSQNQPPTFYYLPPIYPTPRKHTGVYHIKYIIVYYIIFNRHFINRLIKFKYMNSKIFSEIEL